VDGHLPAPVTGEGGGSYSWAQYNALGWTCRNFETCTAEAQPSSTSIEVLGAGLAVVHTAADIAAGAKRATNRLSQALREGSSFAGRNLKRAAALSRQVDKLARAGTPVLVAAVALDVVGGKGATRTAARALGAIVGGAVGGFVCGLATTATGGPGAVTCYVAVAMGSAAGERAAARLYDLISRKKPKAR
jgi:hypothetical protein